MVRDHVFVVTVLTSGALNASSLSRSSQLNYRMIACPPVAKSEREMRETV